MGCTSSAPNMADIPNISDTSGDKTKVEDQVQENITKIEHVNNDCALKEVKLVLASCDNLEKKLQLTSESMPHVEEDKVQEANTQKVNEISPTKTENDEKYTTLKEVVDKVHLDKTFKCIEHMLDSNTVDEKNTNITEDCVVDDITKTSDSVVEEGSMFDIPNNEEESNGAEETTSPSQSDCSRATRWEALADIAAELPPSLAMDPLTGQIYSLAK